MHTPKDCSTLEHITRQQIRLLLQGYFGQGKTFSMTTAPNLVCLNLDNNLGAHVGRKDIYNVPMYDKKFVTKYNTAGRISDAVVKWIADEGSQLTSEQTLGIDGLTNLNNAYDREVGIPLSTRTGKPDLMHWWGEKLDWQKEFFESLKTLRCDVIVCCHEQPEREDEGGLTGKVLPLVQGSFKDQIGTHFTDIFRQHAVNKINVTSLPETDRARLLSNYGFTDVKQFDEFQAQFKGTMYVWQTQPDGISACKTHLIGSPKFVKADWKIFSGTTM